MAGTSDRDFDGYLDDDELFDNEAENFGNKEEFNRPTASYLQMNKSGHSGGRSPKSGGTSNTSPERAKVKPRTSRAKSPARGRKKSPGGSGSSRHDSHSRQEPRARQDPHPRHDPAPSPRVQPAQVVVPVGRPRRLGMFLNGNELFRAQGELGFDFDYEKLFKALAGDETVYNAYFYQIYTPDETKVHGFLNALPRAGYTVRKKMIQPPAEESEESTQNGGTLDLDMVADMISTAALYDHAIICVDDDGGNFVRALEILRGQGKEVTILGRQTEVCDEFVNVADNTKWLEDLKYDIFRPRPGHPTPDA